MLLDTSGLLALIDAREPMHDKACDEYKRALQRVTHGFIRAELVALANSRGLPSGAVLQFLSRLLASPTIDVVWADEALTSQAVAFLITRQGRGYSHCDAVSFVVMRAKNTHKSLSTDHHFEVEGFQRLLA
jgi:uncharacterized protein